MTGPCDDVHARAATELADALEEVRPGLEAVAPGYAGPYPALLLSSVDGGVGLGIPGPASCTSPSGDVVVLPWRPRTLGRTSRYRGASVLEMQRFEESGTSREDWLSVMAHELFHLHHERVVGRELATDYRWTALQRAYERDPEHEASVDGLVRLASVAAEDCSLGAVADALEQHRATLSPRRARDEQRWVVTEGLAKQVELSWLAEAVPDADPEALAMACGNLANPYGYALGCSLARALDRCAEGDAWLDVVMRRGFVAALRE
ncbi:MAG: hypothetical protein KC621_06540 [Myxococcales bacterium]|nr:hypothetical protein [Myxococcales bacterium]